MKYLKYGLIGLALLSIAAAPTFTSLGIRGSSSGLITVQPGSSTAGTYNFNLPTTAGTNGQILTSGGGGASPMTWSAGGSSSSVTPGTTTVVGATAPCVLENSTSTTLACTAETGTGSFVRATSPTLVTPALGTPASGVATNLTGTAASLTAGTATVANGLKSATTTVAVSSATAPTAGQVLTATSGSAADWETLTASAVSVTPGTTTVVGATAPCVLENTASTTMGCTAETGTGSFVRATSPTLVTPALGTPASGVGTNLTGLTLAGHATQTANTVVANVTSGSASPTAASLPSCVDTSGNHLNYTNGTGFSCGTSSSAGPSAITTTAITSNSSMGTLPANGFILYALLRETAGHNATVSIGTTSGGADVLSAQLVPASGTLTVPITVFTVGWFSAVSTQALFLSSTSWGGASVNITLDYQVGP